MLIHPHSRVAARGLLSLALLSGIGLESAGLAGERSGRAPRPAATQPAAAPTAEAEGIVHIWRSPEPEGIVSLRHMPQVGRWIAWLLPGGFAVAAAPGPSPEKLPKANARSPHSMVEDIQYFPASEEFLLPNTARARQERDLARARPVMIAPLDSCTPVDVGRIEDLIFPDPATADRIIRAAGQGFRVVVLSPVADPNPNPEPQDCPRPISAGSGGAVATDQLFPEPTPIQHDPEGHVRLRTLPRPIARYQQAEPTESLASPSSRQAPPGVLVPPAPDVDVNGAFPIAFSAEPNRTQPELSPADHLRIAAAKLSRQGLTNEADQLRSKARDLDSQIDKRLAAIRAQQEELAAEAARLIAIRDVPRQVEMQAEIVEIDRKRMASPEGIALVRRHLRDAFDEKVSFWPQVTSAAVHPEFVREAGQKGFLNVLSRPHLVTTPGQKSTLEIGSQLVLPVVGEAKPQTRSLGIQLTLVPHLDEGGRLRISAFPEITRVDFSNAVTISGQVVPGLHTRRTSTEVTLSFGQTVAIGGFHSPSPHLETREIQQAAEEVVDPHARNYELLFLVTPVAPAAASSPPPSAR